MALQRPADAALLADNDRAAVAARISESPQCAILTAYKDGRKAGKVGPQDRTRLHDLIGSADVVPGPREDARPSAASTESSTYQAYGSVAPPARSTRVAATDSGVSIVVSFGQLSD